MTTTYTITHPNGTMVETFTSSGKYSETVESRLQELVHYKELYKEKFKQAQEEIESLKKEIEELKKNESIWDGYWKCLVSWLDPNSNMEGVEKDHIDEFCERTAIDDLKEDLYELFHIDEDDE